MEDELIRRVTQLAARAPSVRDTRPWRFLPTATGLELYADRDRQLPRLDPTGRQLVVSCGAALGLARLAVRTLGRACTVELLPDEGDLDHLARLSVGPAAPAGGDEMELVRAAGGRPGPSERPVAARPALGRDAEAEQASLRWLDAGPQQLAVAALTNRARRIQLADAALQAELARWPDPGGPGSPGGPGPDGAGDPASAAPSELAVLCTRYDGPTSWLQAGQALVRVLLRADGLGLAAIPLAPALELPWTRRRLRADLGLTGHPQVVLRLGPDRTRRPDRPGSADELLVDATPA